MPISIGHGPGPVQVGGLYAPVLRSNVSGPVPSLCGNSNQSQFISPRELIGYALFFAAALSVPGQSNAAEYQHGTHQVAIHQAEAVKSAVFPAARPAIGSTPRPAVYIKAAPQLDFTQQGSIWAPNQAPLKQVISPLYAAPQSIDLTIQGFIKGAAPTRQGAVPPFSQAAPQLADLTLPALVITPQKSPQGAVPALLRAPPQPDLTQPLPSLSLVLPAPAAAAAASIGQFVAGPQVIDYTLQGWVAAPSLGRQGAVPGLTTASPQGIDLTLQAWITPPAAIAPAAPGILITQIFAAPLQIDLTLQGSVFSPLVLSFPPVIPPQIVGGHGDEDYEYNQRKTREILKIKRRWEREALERAVVKAEVVAVEAAEKVDKVQVSLNVVLEQQTKPIRADQYARFEVRRKILLERRAQLVQEALEKQERLAQAQEELAAEKARIELEEKQGIESLMALMMVEENLVAYSSEEEAVQALLLWLMRDA
jgi:hypothetical protein